MLRDETCRTDGLVRLYVSHDGRQAKDGELTVKRSRSTRFAKMYTPTFLPSGLENLVLDLSVRQDVKIF